MAASKFESIWQLMSQHSFEVDPDCSEDDLTCVICHKLMVDACQSVCGCQYCHECILGYMMGGGDKYCPGNKGECNEEYLVLERNVSRNVRMCSKISKLRVKCPNIGCQEKRELSAIEDHLMVCPKQPVECPYTKVGCVNQGGSKEVIEVHLDGDRFSHSALLIEYIETLKHELAELKQRYERSQEEVEEKIHNLSRFCLNRRCDYIWRIEGFSQKVAMRTPRIDSPPFWLSHLTLRLRVEVSKDDIGLYCVVVDEPPCTSGEARAVTLALLDQWSLDDHAKATFDLTNPHTWSPSNSTERYIIGSASFIKYSSIKENPSLVECDSIVLSCVISPMHGRHHMISQS